LCGRGARSSVVIPLGARVKPTAGGYEGHGLMDVGSGELGLEGAWPVEQSAETGAAGQGSARARVPFGSSHRETFLSGGGKEGQGWAGWGARGWGGGVVGFGGR